MKLLVDVSIEYGYAEYVGYYEGTGEQLLQHLRRNHHCNVSKIPMDFDEVMQKRDVLVHYPGDGSIEVTLFRDNRGVRIDGGVVEESEELRPARYGLGKFVPRKGS